MEQKVVGGPLKKMAYDTQKREIMGVK